MGLNIGRLLYGIRTKYEMNVKDICRGICSPSSYCMYENGEIVPDILLVNMFLDRMGFGILASDGSDIQGGRKIKCGVIWKYSLF